MERLREIQKELYICLLVLIKAYDKVPLQEIWRCIQEKGILEKYMRIIKQIYENPVTRVRSSVT